MKEPIFAVVAASIMTTALTSIIVNPMFPPSQTVEDEICHEPRDGLCKGEPPERSELPSDRPLLENVAVSSGTTVRSFGLGMPFDTSATVVASG
jgi:hypothetical protein